MDWKIIGFGLLLFISAAKSEKSSLPQTSVKHCSQYANAAGVYRLHNETLSCYKVGEKGPCGERMIFYAHPENEDAGECDCDLELRCNRPLMYWAPENRCYLAYEQGPCANNQWLVFTGYHHSIPTCETNPCVSNPTEFDDEVLEEFWFEKDGQCYRTNTQAYCDYSNQVAVFNGFSEKVKPKCSAVEFKCSLPETPSLVCSPGQLWLLSGKCHLSPECDRHRRPYHHQKFHNHHHHSHGGHHGRRHGFKGHRHNNRRDNEEPFPGINEQLSASDDHEETAYPGTMHTTRRHFGRVPKIARSWF